LIVAGDVDADSVKRLAEETYGRIPARAEPPRRRRQKEPPARAERLVTLVDEKVEQPSHERIFVVPSYATAQPGEAEALDVLAHILGGGPASILYETLVEEERLAVSAGAYYMGGALDDTRLYIFTTPAEGVDLKDIDRALDRVLGIFMVTGVSEEILQRAKTRMIADAVYAQDSQVSLARWYGEALATGLGVKDVTSWPDRIDAVTAATVLEAARKWLEKKRSVTGFLLPKVAVDA
jgi:zinc protease